MKLICFGFKSVLIDVKVLCQNFGKKSHVKNVEVLGWVIDTNPRSKYARSCYTNTGKMNNNILAYSFDSLLQGNNEKAMHNTSYIYSSVVGVVYFRTRPQCHKYALCKNPPHAHTNYMLTL